MIDVREFVVTDDLGNPRVVRRKISKFNVKRPEHRDWPQPTMPIEQAIRIIGA